MTSTADRMHIEKALGEAVNFHHLKQIGIFGRHRLTRDVIREIARPVFSAEIVDEFIDERLTRFQQTLVEEFNDRYRDKRPLRFQIADPAGEGRMVAGYRRKKLAQEIRFQNSLHRTTHAEFETLAAVVLKIIGCREVFSTPASHDQGIDAFGYMRLVGETPYGVTHGLTWIAQAKHYRQMEITTGDVRELIGSKELLVAKVFSTVDERYRELRLRLYAPTAVALITTEEMPSTVRRLADGAGVFVFAASDLFYLLGPSTSRADQEGVEDNCCADLGRLARTLPVSPLAASSSRKTSIPHAVPAAMTR